MSQRTPGGPAGGQGPQFIRRGIKLPYTDLGLTDKSDSPAELAREWDLALVLPFGIGPNEPRLIAVDDAGRQIVTGAAGAPGFSTIADDPAITAVLARVYTGSDAVGNVAGVTTQSFSRLWNGASWDRGRSASAIALATKFGTGAVMIAPAGEFSVTHNPAAGVQAIASQAAGGAGVRNIGRRVSFGFSSQAALAGVSTVTFNLRDGATGAGTILKGWTFDLPAAVIAPFVAHLEVSDVGTANTAMTLETAAAVAGLRAFCNLSGFLGV